MRIKMTRGKVVDGEKRKVGDELTTDDRKANHLIKGNAAVEVKGGKKALDEK